MTEAADEGTGRRLRVTLWQHASDVAPAANLAALDRVSDLADGADLVVLPEAFAREFGEPGSDLSPYAETLDGPFPSRLGELAAAHDVTVLAGGLEGCGTHPPFNTPPLSRPGDRAAAPRIHTAA